MLCTVSKQPLWSSRLLKKSDLRGKGNNLTLQLQMLFLFWNKVRKVLRTWEPHKSILLLLFDSSLDNTPTGILLVPAQIYVNEMYMAFSCHFKWPERGHCLPQITYKGSLLNILEFFDTFNFSWYRHIWNLFKGNKQRHLCSFKFSSRFYRVYFSCW